MSHLIYKYGLYASPTYSFVHCASDFKFSHYIQISSNIAYRKMKFDYILYTLDVECLTYNHVHYVYIYAGYSVSGTTFLEAG